MDNYSIAHRTDIGKDRRQVPKVEVKHKDLLGLQRIKRHNIRMYIHTYMHMYMYGTCHRLCTHFRVCLQNAFYSFMRELLQVSAEVITGVHGYQCVRVRMYVQLHKHTHTAGTYGSRYQ